MDELQLYCLMDLLGVEYDEVSIRQGDKITSLRPIKFPPRKYKYVEIEPKKWEIHESIDGGPFKLIILTEDDITKFYEDYPYSEIHFLPTDGRQPDPNGICVDCKSDVSFTKTRPGFLKGAKEIAWWNKNMIRCKTCGNYQAVPKG